GRQRPDRPPNAPVPRPTEPSTRQKSDGIRESTQSGTPARTGPTRRAAAQCGASGHSARAKYTTRGVTAIDEKGENPRRASLEGEAGSRPPFDRFSEVARPAAAGLAASALAIVSVRSMEVLAP